MEQLYEFNRVKELLLINEENKMCFERIQDLIHTPRRPQLSKSLSIFQKTEKLCSSFPNLERLDISLAKTIYPKKFFEGCQSLKFVNMSHMGLHYLDKNMREHFDEIQQRTENLTIDLTGNLFQ